MVVVSVFIFGAVGLGAFYYTTQRVKKAAPRVFALQIARQLAEHKAVDSYGVMQEHIDSEFARCSSLPQILVTFHSQKPGEPEKIYTTTVDLQTEDVTTAIATLVDQADRSVRNELTVACPSN